MSPACDRFVHDLTLAWRSLRHQPTLLCVIVSTLALGIGANPAIFTVANAVLLRSLPYRDPVRLVWIANAGSDFHGEAATGADYILWRDESRALEALAAFDAGHRVTLRLDGETHTVSGARVSSNFLQTLGVQPAHGPGLPPAADRMDGPGSVMIAHSLAERLGARASIGRMLVVDDRRFEVVGVLPRGFMFPGQAGVQVLMPLSLNEPREQARQQLSIVRLVGRLSQGATATLAREELQAIRARAIADLHQSATANTPVRATGRGQQPRLTA